MRILTFLWDYKFVPLTILGGIVAWFFWMKWSRHAGTPPTQKLTNELKAIEAKRQTREVQLQLGAEQARQHVQDKYAEQRKTLDATAEAKAKELGNDPVALTIYLERLTRSDS